MRIGASVPAARVKGGHILWVVEKDKTVKACPSNKAFSVGNVGSITPVDLRPIKIVSIKNGVREHLGDQTLAVV